MNLKSIKFVTVGLLIVMATFIIGFGSTSTFAAPGLKQGYKTATPDNVPPCMFTGSTCTNGVVTTIANTALFIIGSVAVLMLIYGGIRYTISGGDEKAITSAKNTILYSVIGIVVAVAAYAIVNFVIGTLIVL